MAEYKLIDVSEEQKNCSHESFLSKCIVTRLTASETDPTIIGYCLDINIHCAVCGLPFEFIGVPTGISKSFPCVSFDCLELRAPIRPSDGPIEIEIKPQN